MIDKEKLTKAMSEMVQDKDWYDVLANAPGSASLRIALAFYATKNLDSMTSKEKDEYREFRETLESQLNATELKYLAESFRMMAVEAATKHYEELYAKKPPEEQQKAEQEYAELVKRIGEQDFGKGQETAGKEGEQEDGGQGENGESTDAVEG